MGFFRWLTGNWFTLLQSAGIIGSLLFTGISLRTESRVRRVTGLFTITQQHREIWTQLYRRPELARVLSLDADLRRRPVTREEELFVSLLILHLNSAFHATNEGMFLAPERLRLDIEQFFSLPIPRQVWEKLKPLQNADFVVFVESVSQPKQNQAKRDCEFNSPAARAGNQHSDYAPGFGRLAEQDLESL